MAAEEVEEEFLMDSEINRRMLANTVRFTDSSKNGKKPAADCGQGKGYRTCLPRGNKKGKPKQYCGHYTRICLRSLIFIFFT